MSLLDPLTCGFVKVFVFNVTAREKINDRRLQKVKGRAKKSAIYNKQYDHLLQTFPDFDFSTLIVAKLMKSVVKNKEMFERLEKEC